MSPYRLSARRCVRGSRFSASGGNAADARGLCLRRSRGGQDYPATECLAEVLAKMVSLVSQAGRTRRPTVADSPGLSSLSNLDPLRKCSTTCISNPVPSAEGHPGPREQSAAHRDRIYWRRLNLGSTFARLRNNQDRYQRLRRSKPSTCPHGPWTGGRPEHRLLREAAYQTRSIAWESIRMLSAGGSEQRVSSTYVTPIDAYKRPHQFTAFSQPA